MLSSASSTIPGRYNYTNATHNSASYVFQEDSRPPLINLEEQPSENNQPGSWSAVEYKRYLSSLDLQNCAHRRETFEYWPASNARIDFDALSRNGFYFSGVGDMVECYACGTMLGNWAPNQDPNARHRNARRACSHLARMPTAHADQHIPNVERQEHEVYLNSFSSELQDFRRRLNTFVAFHPTCQLRFSNESFCGAGFYATGTRDQVVCWCCGIRLNNFNENDDPWVEHARWSPRCQFVRAARGQDFIDQVTQQFSDQHPVHNPPSLDSLPLVQSGPTRIPSPEPPTMQEISNRHDDLLIEALEQAHTQRAIEIFDSATVTEVIRRKIERDNSYYHTIEALCDAIVDRLRPTSQEVRADQIVEPFRRNSSSPQTGEELRARFREYENERRCKVCLNNRAAVVFLTCRHICACVTCAERLSACPVCRTPILERIQAYFA
uniref:ZF(RING)-22 zinc finger protein n=1 Tax=Phallusia mammillata TaxID=59560 RepID=A0A6F9D716_9ASCI|nr:ZF(RING)-22 zinc finger protein [Phallusia mammillata]